MNEGFSFLSVYFLESRADSHLDIMNEINSYFSAFVKSVWDPLSTSQTENLIQLCHNVFEQQVLSRSERSQARQVKAVVVMGKEVLDPVCALSVLASVCP